MKEWTKEYRAWVAMKARCYCPSTKDFGAYRRNSIQVCERWLTSYPTFLEDMGSAPSPEHSLDRRDNLLGYSPENCRWATHIEQARNTTRTKFYTYQGKTQALKTWCEELNLNYEVVRTRLRQRSKPSFEKAISEDPFDHKVEYKGKLQSLREWSEELSIPYKNLKSRKDKGWEATKIFEHPYRKSRTSQLLN